MTNKSPYKKRMQPLMAAVAMWRLLKNKEDTPQFFRILRALEGPETKAQWKRFQGCAVGQAVLSDRREISELLNDWDILRTMPPGSLGRAYVDWMEEGGANMGDLNAVAAEAGDTDEGLPEDEKLFRRRCRGFHDLFHILSGFGRDRMGELALFAFTYSQFQDRGVKLVIKMGGWDAHRRWPYAGVKETIEEGYRIGRECKWLAGENWEALLWEQVSDLRLRLGFKPPFCYRRTVDFLVATDVEGYDGETLAGLPDAGFQDGAPRRASERTGKIVPIRAA